MFVHKKCQDEWTAQMPRLNSYFSQRCKIFVDEYGRISTVVCRSETQKNVFCGYIYLTKLVMWRPGMSFSSVPENQNLFQIIEK